MGKSLDEFMAALQNVHRPRLCKKTNKYGGEVVRVNQVARTKLQHMVDVSKIPKRSLLSYAVALLYDEFEQWKNGQQESKFGYEVVEVEADDAKADEV